MKIQLWAVDRPQPYAKNARKISDLAVAKVARSIKDFGWRQPIVVDAEDVVIAGHTRLLAAKKLGEAKVPVCVAADLSAEQVKAYRLADNRSHEEAKWDLDLLGAELFDLKELGFDMSGTAFDDEELSDLLGAKKSQELDEVPLVPDDPTTRVGDLYVLGAHRLLCGDSTRAKDVVALMDGLRADLVVTDPPYNVDYTGKTKDALKIENDRQSNADFYKFLYDAHVCMYDVMKDGAGIYVFHADSEGLNFRRALVECGLKLAQCCIWVKQTLVMGRQDYHWQHEPVLYGWKPTGPHHWYMDRKQTTLWEFDRPSRSAGHPTMKPVALTEYPIRNSSKRGDIVLDLFGGSGTTLIACEGMARRCFTMELAPEYCDVIIARWEAVTGKKAVHQETGETFERLREKRSGVAA